MDHATEKMAVKCSKKFGDKIVYIDPADFDPKLHEVPKEKGHKAATDAPVHAGHKAER